MLWLPPWPSLAHGRGHDACSVGKLGGTVMSGG
jgi:hypothetical protein